MTPFDLVLVRLLLAGAGSLVAGCAVWAMMLGCRRGLPLLAQQRTPWLMGQVAVAAVFVAMLVPTTEIYTLSLHDALPICKTSEPQWHDRRGRAASGPRGRGRNGKPGREEREIGRAHV